MTKWCLIVVMVLALFSCKKEPVLNNDDYLIFGHYYGFCAGEECIEIFRLEEKGVYEDRNDTYPTGEAYTGDWEKLSDDVFNDVKNLTAYFPGDLLLETEQYIGSPNVTDGGGLYIEYKSGNDFGLWMIDQFKQHVPEYIHEFHDKVNEKIGKIND